MDNIAADWVVVSNDVSIIATDSGELWFQELEECSEISPFAQPMTGEGSPQTTALLLNGAIALGFGKDGCELQESSATLPKYVFNLVGAYHNSSRTPGHFRQAAARLREIGRPEVAEYLEIHAKEETGHDRLDLPAERIVENLMPEGVKPLCDLFDRLSSADYPIGCIGYSYCFESTAALKQKADVDAMQALCPEGVDASRFMRTHSSLGSEVDHVEDLINFIAGLPASDRIEVVKATYKTAELIAACLRGEGRMPDAAILAQLEAAAGEPIHLAA
jgi:hypothetical protein